MPIQVFTFGQLQIQEDGRVIEGFISTKAVLLFVYLAMHPVSHSRKKLAAMFWSETNDEQALKNLRTVLSSLRQKLTDALIVERDVLSINLERSVEVDAIQFEQGCGTLLSAPDTPAVLAQMQQLAQLYGGRFLADIAIRDAASLDEWISETDRHLHELYTRLMQEIVKRAEAQADYELGIVYGRRLVQLDPYWDGARRHLMRMLTYTNRSSEALREYEAFAELLNDELDAEPETETALLYEQIRTRNIRLPGERDTQSVIVLPDMPFVESPDDIALVQRMLNTPQCRLLTIYGITGVGKTMLATQIAFHRQHLYRDGAYLVMLGQTESASDLAYEIAQALGIEIGGQSSVRDLETRLVAYLKERHVLLVLDNYEHLLPETALVQTILEQAARVQILVTSQVPLNLFREWLLPLQGLRVPEYSAPNPEAFEAVRLFELTAQRINPRFNLKEHLADVVEICHLVDGLPLALIIAAGWTQVVPIKKIRDYILEGQEFTLPVHQDLPPHHQSLDVMLDHTWTALTPDEQYALTALSIFNGAFGIDEVQQVCAVTIDVLMGMIQKLLLQKFDEKYRMHPLVWRYARKKLLVSDQRGILCERYSAFIDRLLSALRQQNPTLHEYLLAIERDYSLIWNYDWMPKPAQIDYILGLSRSLHGYWEISRADQHAALRALFEEFARANLTLEARLLVHLQLARFAMLDKQPKHAYEALRLGMSENAIGAPFADWAVLFDACLPLTHLMEPKGSVPPERADDAGILVAHDPLLSFHFSRHDYEAAEALLVDWVQRSEGSLHRALLLAAWGAVSAETGAYAVAYDQFVEALRLVEPLDLPPLKLNLQTLAMRAAHETGRRDRAIVHLSTALLLSANTPAAAPLRTFAAQYV